MSQDAALTGKRRDELLEFAHAILSARWLVLAALIAQEALTPAPGRASPALYVGILIYTLALTLYAWRYPALATRAARAGVIFDTAAVAFGMQLAGRQQPFFLFGFVVSAIAGLMLGHVGAAVIAGIIGALQVPVLPNSLFAPGLYAAWGAAVLALQAAGHTAAAGAARLHRRSRVAGLLAALEDLTASAAPPAEIAERTLTAVARFFHADSGSLMVVNPRDARLEVLAAHRLGASYRQAKPRLGEGVAGWVVQEGRPVLLTPNTPAPVPLQRSEIGSSICVPVISAGRPVGVLNLNRSPSRRWFSLDDLDTAVLAAHHCAAVLLQVHHEHAVAGLLTDAASGFSAVGRALSRDPAVLWPVLLDQARSLASAQFAILALEREDTGTLDIVAARGISGQTALEYLPGLIAASTDGQIHAAGEAGPPGREASPEGRSGAERQAADRPELVVACVPLRVDAKTIGAIGLGMTGSAVAPAERLYAVAAQTAAAVWAARTAYRVTDIGLVEERRRIAREMHDGLAQTLADALLQTDLSVMAAQGAPGQVASDLKELRGLLERSMRELREFMSELRREPEASNELPVALEAIGKEFQRRAEIPTTVVVTGDASRLPSAVRHAVLAIVRQALTNVRAHARATAVGIRAEITDEAATTSVTDNGIGFDLAAFRADVPGSHHLGLTSMEERAALVGGRLEIRTAPGQGTTVTVRIPMGGQSAESLQPAGG